MARRKNKKHMLIEMLTRPQNVDPSKSLVNQKNPDLKQKTMVAAAAAKGYNLPRPLKRDVIRKICRLPPETCNQKTKAQVMYYNSNYGRVKKANLSRTDFHEPTCPKTRRSKKANENQKFSTASRQRTQKKKTN
ncbi:uncharacterized protein LOC117138358 [Drosophila mauritiana]|uniref:Uncharacterized protein LOC117138358 n=1 Tax=Drosophila mauritiana TaxID=7226 RepID=A0A6P8K1M1_DROMA|nr:uncharacterized protein LOC117138358 [Drosophila mauritiana]XP_033156316.1 uncharacterized protein LOC117138358 [Drosophila mauritiana]